MRLRFPATRIAVSVLAFAALTLVAGCHNNDITGADNALARIAVDAPDTATSGQNFNVQVTAQDIGVQNIQNGVVTVNVPAPLTIVSATGDAGTTASVSGSTVTWNLGVLDANTQSVLTIVVNGTTSTAMNGLIVTAQMTATGINAGDAVATDTLNLNP